MGLTFDELQYKNAKRGQEWTKGATGDTNLEFAVIELAGEVGELANAVKKRLRWLLKMPGGVEDLEPIREELGDVAICASLLANKLGVNLGDAVRDKFNKTSEKHGFETRL